MKTIGNIAWLAVSGLWLGLGYITLGFLSCLTIIGIPFGFQALKLAQFVMWPFGRQLVAQPGPLLVRGVLNVFWIVFAGLWLALFHLFIGTILCLTIIGIPFGLKNFSMARLALFPFGYVILPTL